jgi:hypothetical protein
MSKLTLVVTHKNLTTDLTPEAKSNLLLDGAEEDSVKSFENFNISEKITQLMIVFSPEIEKDGKLIDILRQLRRKINNETPDVLNMLILRWVDDDFKTLNTSDLVQKSYEATKDLTYKTSSFWFMGLGVPFFKYKCISLEGLPGPLNQSTFANISLVNDTESVEIHHSRIETLRLEPDGGPSNLKSIKLNGNHNLKFIVLCNFCDPNSNNNQNTSKLTIEFDNCGLKEVKRTLVDGTLKIHLDNIRLDDIHLDNTEISTYSCCCFD